MSYNQYSGYGGNPYGGEQQSYGASNPYSSEAGNPYGGGYEGQAVVSSSWCLARSNEREERISRIMRAERNSERMRKQKISRRDG